MGEGEGYLQMHGIGESCGVQRRIKPQGGGGCKSVSGYYAQESHLQETGAWKTVNTWWASTGRVWWHILFAQDSLHNKNKSHNKFDFLKKCWNITSYSILKVGFCGENLIEGLEFYVKPKLHPREVLKTFSLKTVKWWPQLSKYCFLIHSSLIKMIFIIYTSHCFLM